MRFSGVALSSHAQAGVIPLTKTVSASSAASAHLLEAAKSLPGQPQEHEPEKKSQEKRSDGVYYKESPFGFVFWSGALSVPVYIRIERQVIGNRGEYNGKAKNATRKMVSYKRHYKKNCPDCEDHTREEM